MRTAEQKKADLWTDSNIKRGGVLDKIGLQARAKMHEQFILHVNPQVTETILDIGACSNPTLISSNYLESNYPKLNIVATGLGETNLGWEKMYPQIPYIHGTALQLPFEDNSFDIAYSHAVIEHVGNFDNQVKMISEALRVARRAVWISTPNRWHPMEFHTILPFIHWLPKRAHRFFLRGLGNKYYSREETLNLLDIRSLQKAVYLAEHLLKIKNIKATIFTSRSFGFTANLLLYIMLDAAASL